MLKWKGTIEVVVEGGTLAEMVEAIGQCVEDCQQWAASELVGLVDVETGQPPEPKIVPSDLIR